MDLESGGTIYVEARVDQRVTLIVTRGMATVTSKLTIEETRTLANALLVAAAEAKTQRD